MAEVITMPKLSDTMEEGVIAEWHKEVGDEVKSGDLLAEIETDKATMEFESFQDGTLLYKGLDKGEGAPVGGILVILGEKGEEIDSLIEQYKQEGSKQEEKPAESEKGTEVSAEKEQEKPVVEDKSSTPSASPSGPATGTPAPQASADSQGSTTSDGRVKASPLARSLAKEKNIPIESIQGSGYNGRIVKKDVETFKGAAKTAAATAPVGEESYTDEPVSQMRKTIAKRLSESKFTAPHFYLTIEIDMDKAVEARKSINEEIEPEKISFNDLVLKAAAHALKKHPKVNASYLGDKIRYYDHVHIGVAVAVEEGLLVPVVRFADGKSLVQIGNEVKDYAEKAQSKKLQPEDWEGNTFTISNLGMYGIEEFTAIINSPDACILAVGGINEKPVVKNGEIVPGKTMKVTLSCDHRVVDGATGSSFLQTFKRYMENPLLLLGVAV